MSTVVDNKGLEAPSPVAAFLKRNMQLLLVTVALFVVLAFFSVALLSLVYINVCILFFHIHSPEFLFQNRKMYLD